MNNQFKPEQFFDLSSFSFKDIFDGVVNIWEVLPKIKEYTGGKLLQGKNCFIALSVNIREGVILGDNVHIGHCVELKNCIIMNGTHIAHLNYVGDSIVGSDCNFGGGSMVANFRLDHEPIIIKYNGESIQTNLKKFGAVVGDSSQIGVNSVLNPGTILGKNCKVYPLVSVVGFHKESLMIK